MDKKIVLDNNILFPQVIEMLQTGYDTVIPVKGFSMMPIIRSEQDTVILEGVEAGTPQEAERKRVKPYDIVLFSINNHFILHRIISISDNGIATIQGDGNIKGVEHCDLNHIYGRVKVILRNGQTEMNPYTTWAIRRFKIWRLLFPIRRYLLWIYRKLS